MTRLERFLCWLGFHVIDPAEVYRRRLRAARMGVRVTGSMFCTCTRCGRSIWR
jgi:hypothetical protein